MAEYKKTLEEVIKTEIVYFNKTHEVPRRFSDDCNQEIAMAIVQLYDRICDRDPWYVTARIRSAAKLAGERFITAEKIHESHFSHEKNDNEFLCECAQFHIHHMAVCNVLNNTIKTLLTEAGFTDCECKIVMMVLNTSDGKIPFKEIKNDLGIKANRTRQIYAKILRKFRHPKRSQILIDYFDLLE